MSDSHLSAPQLIVIGTAGHIDHGKTSLVRALTGTETDRLAEEKRRGISIDLGFAHLTLPNGGSVSFVDVPGHERFIRNMLAGAGGIEAVLLVVAADESVKPQTREHFEICRLLGVREGVVVLTKCDVATEEQLAATRSAVDDLRAGSFLADAPVIAVSSVTGAGLGQLVESLETLFEARTRRDSGAVARLPLDRSFALKGFGTVVTGTLWSGTLRVGDTVQLHPSGQEARIRGLQTHGESVEFAAAGQRTAVNLSGIEHSKIQRGFVLTHPKTLEPVTTIEASVTWLNDMDDPGSQQSYLFHIGASEIPARIQILSPTLIRVKLAEPAIALPGDRFVLRRPSPSETIGGGVVIDSSTPKRMSRAKAAQRLEHLQNATLASRLEFLVEEKEPGRTIEELTRATGRRAEVLIGVLAATDRLMLVEESRQVISKAWRDRRRERLTDWLGKFHSENPSLAGAPIVQARLGLSAPLANAVFKGFPTLRVEGDLVALSNHKVQVSKQENAALLKLEQEFRKAAYQPASASEMVRGAGFDAKNGRILLQKLIKDGRLVRVSEELVFHADIVAHIRNSLAAHKGLRFSVPEFKGWTQISRKYAIPLLEYLDHQRVTKREGGSRLVL